MKSRGRGVLDTPLEPVIGLAEGETRWRGMTACGARPVARGHSILLSIRRRPPRPLRLRGFDPPRQIIRKTRELSFPRLPPPTHPPPGPPPASPHRPSPPPPPPPPHPHLLPP